MTLAPLLSAPSPIPAHALLAFVAFALGIWQLVGRKGTSRHRLGGWIWVALMAFVAASGFFIHSIRLWGQWSPIHLLSIITLASLVAGVLAARRGRIRSHRHTMLALFWLALVVTGAFTFLPGRIMWSVATGG